MLKLLISLVLLGPILAPAQTIIITATGGTDTVIEVTKPVNGFYNFPNSRHYLLDSNSSVKLSYNVRKAENICITYNNKRTYIFIEPGTAIHVTLATKNDHQSLAVQGSNAEGITLAGNLDHPYYQLAAQNYRKKDSTMTGLSRLIDHDLGVELRIFDSLLADRKISSGFYSNIRRDIQYYYSSVKAAIILGEYNLTLLDSSNRWYKPTFDKDMAAAWPVIYKKFPLDRSASGSRYFFDYARDYIVWYKLLYQRSEGSIQRPLFSSDNQFKLIYNAIDTNFTGSIKEYLLASYLLNALLQEDYERQLVDVYNRFTTAFPRSAYTSYLKPSVDKIKTYLNKAASDFKPDQHLLNNGDFHTVDDLLGHFKDGVLFVDMWATWCGPCKAQFEYRPELEKYLAAHNVSMLYVSMDYDREDKKWQEMIKYYELAGYHLRASDSLRSNLARRFWGGEGYSIPRYLIIKNGVVVENDALRPGDKQQLFDQIGRYL